METLTPEELAESEQKIDDFMRKCGQEEGELGVGVLLERRRPPPVSQDSVEMLAMVEDVRTKLYVQCTSLLCVSDPLVLRVSDSLGTYSRTCWGFCDSNCTCTDKNTRSVSPSAWTRRRRGS